MFQREFGALPEVEIHRHKRQHELPRSGDGEGELQKSGEEEPLKETAAATRGDLSGLEEVSTVALECTVRV